MNTTIRPLVRGAYDIQKLRIQAGNRIVGNFKVKLGQLPGHTEEGLDDEAKAILKELRELSPQLADSVVEVTPEEEVDEAGEEDTKKKAKLGKLVMDLLVQRYRVYTENRKTFPTQATFKGDCVISSFTELSLVAQYFELRKSEEMHFKRMEGALREIPFYNDWLAEIKGIGPAMAGVLLSEISIEDEHVIPLDGSAPYFKKKYASSLWQYAGLGVEADGKGTSKRKEHMHDIQYKDAEGALQLKKGIRHNPFLKTKLCGVLAPSFLRAGENKYSTIYRNYKNRLENHPNWKDKTKGHRHQASMRYAVKMFLIDLYMAWRTHAKLVVHNPYAEAKLGMIHKTA